MVALAFLLASCTLVTSLDGLSGGGVSSGNEAGGGEAGAGDGGLDSDAAGGDFTDERLEG